MTTPLIQLEDVERTFAKARVTALQGLSLEIEKGDSFAVCGPSGSGKSTLLHLLGAMDTPTAGRIRFRGSEPENAKQQAAIRAELIGFVFQSFHLLPTLTALENIQVPMFGVVPKSRDRKERAKELLENVSLSHRAAHLPGEMSGGERQRIAIARALANDPDVILADEPTGNLDSTNSAKVLDLLIELREAKDLAMVVVTHDQAVAGRFDRTVNLLDGRVED
ncbi:MAG: ABC transporter ATP-binding protein [Verrucomicrobiota bacterium]